VATSDFFSPQRERNFFAKSSPLSREIGENASNRGPSKINKADFKRFYTNRNEQNKQNRRDIPQKHKKAIKSNLA